MTANTTRGLASDICTVAEKEASYLDRPGGVILESGKARVEFCSDSDTILVCNHYACFRQLHII